MSRPSILNSIERQFILLVVDMVIILASLNVLINHATNSEFITLRYKIGVFGFGVLAYLVLSYVLEFYRLDKVTKRIYVLSQGLYIGVLFVFVIFMFTVIVYDVSFWRKTLLYFLVLTPIQIGLWRLFFRDIFQIIPITKNVLYIYDDETSKNFKEDTAKIDGEEKNTFYKVKLTYSLDQNKNLNKKLFLSATDKIDAWILNVKNYDSLPVDMRDLMLQAILKGKEVISYTTFYESSYEALPLRSNNDSFYEILQLRNSKIRYLRTLFSFAVNFVLSLIVGLMFVSVAPFVWFFNQFLNKGPLFYTQKRVGLHGKEFKIYKFRSMVVDAEKSGAAMATQNDSRITPFGKILRVFRIDELPQIISVIKGDMQFIGPRPERKVFVKELNKLTPFYNARHLIRPGITGWAQVKFKYGQNLDDSIQKLEYDLYYIKNKSITLDLRIIFKTVTTVLFSRGI